MPIPPFGSPPGIPNPVPDDYEIKFAGNPDYIGMKVNTATWGPASLALAGSDTFKELLAPKGLAITSNANLDASGTYEPFIDLRDTGYMDLVAEQQGAAGNNYVRVRALDGFKIETNNTGFEATISANSLTGNRTISLPNATTTLVGTDFAQTLTNKTIDGDDNTLTDIPAANLKIASQAQGDLLYASTASAWARLGAGTSGHFLKTQGAGANPVWAAVTAGQSTYDAIVATSGGDYTTLGAALAAASNGWSIFVKEGTYSESAISSSLTNLTIVGENYATSVISMTTNNFSLTGVNLNIRNLQISSTTGTVTMSGAETVCQNCYLLKTSTGDHLTFSGANAIFANNKYLQNSATEASGKINALFSGSGQIITGNWIKGYDVNSNSAQGAFRFTGTFQTIANNWMEASVNQGRTWIDLGGSGSRFEGNGVRDTVGLTYGIITNASDISIVGNYISVGSSSKGINVSSSLIYVVGNYISSATALTINASVSNSTISGNSFKGTSGSPIGIDASGSNLIDSTITGNTFVSSVKAVDFGSGSTRNVFVGNNITGSTTNTAVITDTGSVNECHDNVGVSFPQEKRFIVAKNTSGGTLAAGATVIFKTGVAAGNEVTTTTTAGDDYVYGMNVASLTNNSFGYIQVLGKTTLLKVNGTTDIAVGDMITCYTSAGIAAKAAAGDMVFAYALEAYTGNDDNGVIDAIIINPRLI